MSSRTKTCAHPFCLMYPGTNGYCSRCPTNPPEDPLKKCKYLKKLTTFVDKLTKPFQDLISEDLMDTLTALIHQRRSGKVVCVSIAQIKHLLPAMGSGYTFNSGISLPKPSHPVDILCHYFVLDWWNFAKHKDINPTFDCYWGGQELSTVNIAGLYEHRHALMDHKNFRAGRSLHVREAYRRVLQ